MSSLALLDACSHTSANPKPSNDARDGEPGNDSSMVQVRRSCNQQYRPKDCEDELPAVDLVPSQSVPNDAERQLPKNHPQGEAAFDDIAWDCGNFGLVVCVVEITDYGGDEPIKN